MVRLRPTSAQKFMNHFMKKLFLLFQFLPVMLVAQRISGIVTDSASVPIANAAVLVNNRLVAYSATDGSFIIRLPDKGDRIRITHIAYRPFETEFDGEIQSLKVILSRQSYPTDEVIISATRAGRQTATAFVNLEKEDIEKVNTGKDLPFIIEMTPSATATSDAGHGVGYTGLWIRGSDPSRINVTINGVPVNDAESQLVFWVDLPDLSSSADNMQIQRGAGTSANGAGAFGGSINIQTNKLFEKPYANIHSSVGSFGTVKNTLQGGTGLVNNRFTFDVRLSTIRSDGYIDRASADLKSVFVSHGYYGKKTTARLNIFSGKEITYQSWYGVPEARIRNDLQGMISFILRNGLDSQDSLNLLTAGRTYNYYTYKNQVDDYQQDNYQLHLAHQFGPKIFGSLAAHFTRGKGFYEEFKKHQRLGDYGIDDSLVQPIIGPVNLVRRKWLDNDFYGTVYSLQAEPSASVKFTLGGAWNQYLGDHFGDLIWATYLPVHEIPYRYYFNQAMKTDFNSFLKANWSWGPLSFYGDLQFRRTGYHFSRPDATGNPAENDFDEVKFFNPKAGIAFQPGPHQRMYASVARAGKEPSRKDYLDNPGSQRPRPERMTDFEAGYEFRTTGYSATVNFYHMQYDNQLVLNGSVNDVGEPLRINVKDSYRQGAELMFSAQPAAWFNTSGNLTLSRNRIRSYYEVIPDYDEYINDSLQFENTPISFSPEVIAAWSAEAMLLKNFRLGLQFKYTGKQFLDNTGNETRQLNAYHFFNVYAGYRVTLSRQHQLDLSCTVYNVTHRLYETNGYTYSYIYAGERITENFYYPQAGRHLMIRAGLKF